MYLGEKRLLKTPKNAFVVFRFLLLACAWALIHYQNLHTVYTLLSYLIIVSIIVYNLFLLLLPNSLFERFFTLFAGIGFLLDISVTSLLILVTPVPSKTLVLVMPYFITILVATLLKRLPLTFLATFAGALAYGLAIFSPQTSSPISVSSLLWFAFFYVSALIAGYLSETTSKRKAEEEKRIRDELVREATSAIQCAFLFHELLLENIPTAVAMVTPEGKINICNQRFCELLGKKRNELGEKGLFQSFEEKPSITLLKEKIAKMLKGKREAEVNEISVEEGSSKRYFAIRIIPLSEEKACGGNFLLLLEDITSAKESENRRLHLARLSGGVELLGTLFSRPSLDELSTKAVVESIQENAKRILDFTAMAYLDLTDDEKVLNVYFMEPVGEEFVRLLKERMSGVAGVAEKEVSAADFKLKILKGEIEPTKTEEVRSFFAVPLVADTKMHAIIAFASTRAEQFSSEEIQILYALTGFYSLEMARLKAVKEAAAKELEAEISRQKLQMEEEKSAHIKKMGELKERLFTSLAHQLRTPVSSLKSSIQFLRDGHLGALTKEQEEYIEVAARGIERLARIIEDILTITRLEEKKEILEKKFTLLRPLIEEVVTTYKPLAEQRNATIEVDVPYDCKAFFDERAFIQILSNLLLNALIHNPSGITVKIEACQEGDSFIRVSVSDNGVGIPEEDLPRVFDKFSCTERSMKSGTRGAGLGLAVSKELVEAQGGRIWLESKSGEGTTVSFTLRTSAF
ncbi:MAG: ATP-binding protein [Planctomycetota bacterium]|nr:ATP-binding protein [Planctomycetota bacterium]